MRGSPGGERCCFVASAGETPVGYALVVWHEGADDTFPLAPRYAEVYTLSVAEQARGAGVGARLLDAVDEALAGEGDPPLVIAVMAGNTDALRFYARRGLMPGELLLYRFPAARASSAGDAGPTSRRTRASAGRVHGQWVETDDGPVAGATSLLLEVVPAPARAKRQHRAQLPRRVCVDPRQCESAAARSGTDLYR